MAHLKASLQLVRRMWPDATGAERSTPALERLDRPGYHLVAIPRGALGELSKVQEELDELRDAMAQDSRVMATVELSDLVGALQAYLDTAAPGTKVSALMRHRAGARTAQIESGVATVQTQLDALKLVHAGTQRQLVVPAAAELVAALEEFMDVCLPGLALRDLVIFSNITKRAFYNGHRTAR
jgi:hypothetical protein